MADTILILGNGFDIAMGQNNIQILLTLKNNYSLIQMRTYWSS